MFYFEPILKKLAFLFLLNSVFVLSQSHQKFKIDYLFSKNLYFKAKALAYFTNKDGKIDGKKNYLTITNYQSKPLYFEDKTNKKLTLIPAKTTETYLLNGKGRKFKFYYFENTDDKEVIEKNYEILKRNFTERIRENIILTQ